jgi:superoxide dismutase, Cu-Zn family
MKKIILLTAIFLITIICCTKKALNEPVAPSAITQLNIDLFPKSDSKVSGKAIFTEKNGVVTLVATISGLTEGEHGIHLHDKADCTAANGSSAGGHWNPIAKNHGKFGSDAYHRGDIGNIKADAAGNASITFSTNEWCIGCADEKKNIVGKGIIVHKDPDDFVTQASATVFTPVITPGNAGARIACGGIIK